MRGLKHYYTDTFLGKGLGGERGDVDGCVIVGKGGGGGGEGGDGGGLRAFLRAAAQARPAMPAPTTMTRMTGRVSWGRLSLSWEGDFGVECVGLALGVCGVGH